ncbi:MAG: NINE protein [Candidatus Cloacimonetes bacterium]|nr:NINE protein [Candidatus Cloacimonadota bacterium]
MKNKLAAAVLAFFLGGFGVHKFYLGRPFMGLLYLLFCWTGIPSFISVIEAVILLISSEEQFHLKYNTQYLLAANLNPGLTPAPAPSSNKSVAEQLEDLNELHVKGTITDKEFERLKSKLIG